MRKGRNGLTAGGVRHLSPGGRSAQDSPRLLASLWHCVPRPDGHRKRFQAAPPRGKERHTAAFLPLPFLPPFAITVCDALSPALRSLILSIE